MPLTPRLRGVLWRILIPAHLTITTLILLNDHLLEATFVTGSSMSPTLSPNYSTTHARDLLLWSKARPTHNLKRGDVILFSAPHNPESTAVKRVIALGGDTVLLDPRRRPQDVANGRVNEAARNWDQWKGRVVVPPGHVWVEGDNWRWTKDSHYYGPVSKGLILGRAWGLLWPAGQLGARPWEGYKVKTKVLEGQEGVVRRRADEGVPTWEPHG